MSSNHKTLVIIGGKIGQNFLERLHASNDTRNPFHIVYYDNNISPLERDNYTYYRFDSSSLAKLTPLLNSEIHQILLISDKKLDVKVTIENIRKIRKQLRVVFVNLWELNFDDPNLVSINSLEVLSNRMMGYLPDVPIVAQNIGLGSGEIMEVIVPFGSSYVYRHLSTVRQKNWRIVALYRNNKMILSTKNTMIQPNDRLLIVGEPPVLKSVNHAIKRQLGQFPAPFGKNIYLFIDMRTYSEEEIKTILNQALFLHQKFMHKLFIRIINPRLPKVLEDIKCQCNNEIIVLIDYACTTTTFTMQPDIETFFIGLILVNSTIFRDKRYRFMMYKTRIPVLKLSKKSIKDMTEAIVPITEEKYVNNDLEKISTSIYDVSSQLGLRMTLFDFIPQEEEDHSIIEHFENLSAIFSKRFHIVKSKYNPIRSLQKHSNFLQCIPFNEAVLPRKWHFIFSTDSHKLYYKLDAYHQVFIPTKL